MYIKNFLDFAIKLLYVNIKVIESLKSLLNNANPENIPK